MNVLFVHNNFPAQYRYLARALARNPDVRMMAIGSGSSQAMPGVKLKKYSLSPSDLWGTHPFARRFDLECQRAEQVLYSISSLVSSGFVPDVILAHPGWGETLPLRIMFPDARILLYCEFFYGDKGRDVDFDPEFPKAGLDGHIGLKLKNATTLLALDDADIGVSPTEWQRSTYPLHYQHKIAAIHEGVDVDVAKPDRSAVFRMPSGGQLTSKDEVVTFVVRNLEPLRGYHIFMRALPRILAQRPHAQIVIVGGDGLSYGMPPPAGTTWKSLFLNEVADRIDAKRVHFVGHLPYQSYIKALQVSSAHVYLTYPFVLSWSLLEAMSMGCVVIGSDTAPVREVIDDGHTGMLVPFFDVAQLSDRVIDALANPRRFDAMRANARQYVKDQFDMERVCLPQMIELIQSKAGSPSAVLTGTPKLWPGRKREPDSAVVKKVKATRDEKKQAAPIEKLPEPPVQPAGRARLIAKRVVSKKSANPFDRSGR